MALGSVYVRPFGQAGGVPTVNVVATTTTANVAVSRPNIGTQSVRIVNAGTSMVFIEFGKTNAVVASVLTSMPMLAGTVETFLLPNDITFIAAIGATTGSTVYITTGESA